MIGLDEKGACLRIRDLRSQGEALTWRRRSTTRLEGGHSRRRGREGTRRVGEKERESGGGHDQRTRSLHARSLNTFTTGVKALDPAPSQRRNSCPIRKLARFGPIEFGHIWSMGLILAVFLLILIFGGIGFSIHFLWIVAAVLLVMWLVGFGARSGDGHWYRW